jgi:hypothetical protein
MTLSQGYSLLKFLAISQVLSGELSSTIITSLDIFDKVCAIRSIKIGIFLLSLYVGMISERSIEFSNIER